MPSDDSEAARFVFRHVVFLHTRLERNASSVERERRLRSARTDGSHDGCGRGDAPVLTRTEFCHSHQGGGGASYARSPTGTEDTTSGGAAGHPRGARAADERPPLMAGASGEAVDSSALSFLPAQALKELGFPGQSWPSELQAWEDADFAGGCDREEVHVAAREAVRQALHHDLQHRPGTRWTFLQERGTILHLGEGICFAFLAWVH